MPRKTSSTLAPGDVWLLPVEVQEELRLSHGTIYNLLNSGRLVSHSFGDGSSLVRIKRSDLDAFIESSRRTPEVNADAKPPALKNRRRVVRNHRTLVLDIQSPAATN